MSLTDHMTLWVEAPPGKMKGCNVWWSHCGSGDMLFLHCIVVSQDHVIQERFEFIYRSSLRYVTTRSGLLVISTLTLQYWRYDVLSLSSDITKPSDHRVM